MTELVVEALAGKSGLEVTDHLQAAGVTVYRTWTADDGMHIVVAEGQDDEALAALNGWEPTATSETYVKPLPDGIRTHLQHLRDYLAKDPATITNAESIHVIKDLIRAVHFLNDRLASEG